MIARFAIAWLLMALCVAIHATGLTAAFRRIESADISVRSGFWGWTRALIALAGWTILIHVLEIALWGIFYSWKGVFDDFGTALYFSAATYTTTGYGDVVLPSDWHLIGAIEALTGILMNGLSTGFFFAAVNRMHRES